LTILGLFCTDAMAMRDGKTDDTVSQERTSETHTRFVACRRADDSIVVEQSIPCRRPRQRIEYRLPEIDGLDGEPGPSIVERMDASRDAFGTRFPSDTSSIFIRNFAYTGERKNKIEVRRQDILPVFEGSR
jgi:hypothetical protein